ncbi:hypothetical protein LIER_17872 [Lithospermum erythrorhizon]|uniref:Uncharacterized protein n=1 Tax=Lithospermum erythrorhizon TaxID=34254 RepID=A0AAV3QHH5_LITER
MLDRLYVKQLARPIEEEGIRPTGTNVQEWSELDRRCLGYIHATISKEMISNVILNKNRRRGSNMDNKTSSSDALVFEKKKRIKKKGKQLQGKLKKDKKEDQCHYCDKMGH